jgi:hypothetical protein
MKKTENYLSPDVMVTEVKVELGFAQSVETTSYQNEDWD